MWKRFYSNQKLDVIDVNFRLWKKVLHLFRLAWTFKGIYIQEILVVGGGCLTEKGREGEGTGGDMSGFVEGEGKGEFGALEEYVGSSAVHLVMGPSICSGVSRAGCGWWIWFC